MRTTTLLLIACVLLLPGCGDPVDPQKSTNDDTSQAAPPALPLSQLDVPWIGWNEFVWQRHSEMDPVRVRQVLMDDLIAIRGQHIAADGKETVLDRVVLGARIARLSGLRGSRGTLVELLAVTRGRARFEVARAVARLSHGDAEEAEARELLLSDDDWLLLGVLVEMSEDWADTEEVEELLSSAHTDRTHVRDITASILTLRNIKTQYEGFHDMEEPHRIHFVSWIITSAIFARHLSLSFSDGENFWVPSDLPAGTWGLSAYREVSRTSSDTVEAAWKILISKDPAYAKGREVLDHLLAERRL